MDQSTTNMAGNSTNRYSMPVTRSRSYIADLNLDSSLDGNNTTGFLFGDEDTANGEAKAYQQVNNADNFPTLVRNAGYPSMVSLPSFRSNVRIGMEGRNDWLNVSQWLLHHQFQMASFVYPHDEGVSLGPCLQPSQQGSRTS
jgi:hypothetical protein